MRHGRTMASLFLFTDRRDDLEKTETNVKDDSRGTKKQCQIDVCRTTIERPPFVDAVAVSNPKCSSAGDANGCSVRVPRNAVVPRVCHRTLCSALECVPRHPMSERTSVLSLSLSLE